MKLFAVIVLALAVAAASAQEEEQTAPQSQLADALRNALQSTVEKIQERVNVKHQKATDLLEKAQELAERLRQLKSDAGDKIRDLVSNNKGKLQELFQKLREKVQAQREKRQVVDLDQVKEALTDLKANTKDRFTQFAQWVREQVAAKLQAAKDKKDRLLTIAREVRDHAKEMKKGAVREAIEALRPFREQLGDNWQQALESARNVLRPTTPRPQEETREKRAVDLDQVKEALTDLKANTKDRFTEFAKWVREQVAAKLQAARDAKERYLTIAREVRDHAKEMKQGAVREAIEALRPHREELGNTWRQALEAARNALGRRPTAAPQA